MRYHGGWAKMNSVCLVGLGSLRLTWAHSGSLGLTKAHSGSFRFTWAHSGSLRQVDMLELPFPLPSVCKWKLQISLALTTHTSWQTLTMGIHFHNLLSHCEHMLNHSLGKTWWPNSVEQWPHTHTPLTTTQWHPITWTKSFPQRPNWLI